MARVTARTCDICGRPTEEIVGKLQYVPIVKDVKFSHSQYTHHADVGVCCKDKIFRAFRFQPRVTAAEYQAQRRAGTRKSYSR